MRFWLLLGFLFGAVATEFLAASAAVATQILAASAAVAAEPMANIYHRDEPDIDLRNNYVWRVMRTALDRTVPAYGPYVMGPATTMKEARRIWTLEHDTGAITLSLFPARADLEGKLIAVRIPVDLGLLGYRVLLIRDGDQPRFDKIASLADLSAISFGLVQDWDDVAIMQNAGLTVIKGGAFDGIFKMVSAGRADAFSRGVSEVLPELDRRRGELSNLRIEQHLLLHYPLPHYFFFPKTARGRRNAERLRAGLESMVADGTLRAMFEAEFGAAIAQLDVAHRKVIELSNPLLAPDEPFGDQLLWYHP